MRLFTRLLGYVRPYWRRLLAALLCMALFAVLSTISLGMILPFMNVLFQGETIIGQAGEAVGFAGAAAPGEATDSGSATSVDGEPSLQSVTSGGLGRDLQVPSMGDLKERLRARVLSLFESASPGEALGKICVALLVLFLAKSLFGYLQTYLMVSIEQHVTRDLRDALFTHFSELSLSFFHGTRTGQLISRVTSDVTLVRRAMVATFANLFREALLALLYLGLAIWISWRLALITFAVLPPIIFLVTKIGQRLRRRSARLQEKMADITATLEESIAGIRVVKAFGMEGYERRRFFAHTREYFRTSMRLEVLSAAASPLVEYLGVVGVVVILWYGGRQVVLGGGVSPDWFLVFLGAVLSSMDPLRKLSRANNDMQIGLAAAGRIFEILDTKPKVVDPENGLVLSGFDDAIRYEGVHFRYDTGDEVLVNINLTIRRGEIVAIVGPSGAGKSTLLDLLSRFYDPTEGRVTIDGADLREVETGSLRRLLGIVTQETILFNDTVRNNIAYGLDGADDATVVAAAKAANAHEFISAMPRGYDTQIGERGVMLSGGERQRIAIARAILKNPPILILDEATSSLDTESERLVQEAIEHLLEGRTVLVIAHRLSTVSNADRIVVIDHGAIRETGTHGDLMDRGGLYRHLYNMQFRDNPVSLGEGRGSGDRRDSRE
ncbi:MAG: ABC transporter ATP-binding protein [Candidatus Eisenbacteria bacterium]|nr:ABC transporter ATP-binding protein [Candidatus Eisenbacteria bacterium]